MKVLRALSDVSLSARRMARPDRRSGHRLACELLLPHCFRRAREAVPHFGRALLAILASEEKPCSTPS